MAVDAREPLRNYPIPDEANFTADEFPRLRQALQMVGGDIDALLSAVAAKAPLSHSHTISQVTGLQAALDGKQPLGSRPSYVLDDLADVDTTEASTYQVLAKIGGQWIPWTVDLGHSTGFAGQLATSVIDAAQVTTGVLDPARIPVLAAQNTIVSPGAVANLTSAQQDQIATGTHVTTTDGRRWIYKGGGGSKTAEASYIELADVTPEWSMIANKPFGAFGLTLGAAPDLATAKTALALTKADVGLGNVDNTSDLAKRQAIPACFAHRNGAGTISTSPINTWIKVNMGSLGSTSGGMSLSNGEVLIPQAGIYHIAATGYFSPMVNSTVLVGIAKNGAIVSQSSAPNGIASSSFSWTIIASRTETFAANDKVAFYIQSNVAGNSLGDAFSLTNLQVIQVAAA